MLSSQGVALEKSTHVFSSDIGFAYFFPYESTNETNLLPNGTGFHDFPVLQYSLFLNVIFL